MTQENNQVEKFDFSKFLQDSKNVLLNPKEYFSSFAIKGGYVTPIIKALIYGAVAGLFRLIWSISGLTMLDGGLLGGAVGIGAFFISIIGAVIGLFIGAIIILIISSICGGNNDFEANTRVSAALMVLMPLSAFLGFFESISLTLHSIVILAVNIYGIWILYNAIVHSLTGKVETTKIISYVLAGLLLIFMIIGLASKRIANKYAKDLDTSEFMKDYKKTAEKIVKDYEETTQKIVKEIGEDYDETTESLEDSFNFKIQMASGEVLTNIDKENIKSSLNKLDKDNNFMTLSKGTGFIQTSLTDEGYMLEYSDISGYFRAKENNLTKDNVENAFIGFFKNDKEWKNNFNWEEAN